MTSSTMIRSPRRDDRPLSWEFLRRYSALDAGLSARQALVEAIRAQTAVQKIHVGRASDGHSTSHAIIWDRDSLPALTSEEPSASSAEQRNQLFIPSGPTRYALTVNVDHPESLDPEELESLADTTWRLDRESAARPKPEIPQIPLSESDDLVFLREHLGRAYGRFRQTAAMLFGVELPSASGMCFFLLYDRDQRALVYPDAGFYSFTEAGRQHIELHLSRIGRSAADLAARDIDVGRQLLLDIFCEALNALKNPNLHFESSLAGDALRCVGRACSEVDRFVQWVNGTLLNVDQGSPLRVWSESTATSADGVNELMTGVLQLIPQGLNAGFATRCFRTGTSFAFENRSARSEWTKGVNTDLLEPLAYELIGSIERHYFWGSFDQWLADEGHRRLKDPDDTLVAMAPMMARGLPLGMFFTVERLPQGADSVLLRRLTLGFVEANAARAADLVQRVRETAFVAKCRTAMLDGGFAGGPDLLLRAVMPNLPVLFGRSAAGGPPLFVPDGVAKGPPDGLQRYECDIETSTNHGAPPTTLSAPVDAYTDRYREHQYEFVSLVSAAFLHHESGAAGLGSAFAAIRHSLVNLAGAPPGTVPELIAAIRMEALCAEGVEALFSGTGARKRNPPRWSDVGWGASFPELLNASVPGVIVESELPDVEIDCRLFPLLHELVRNSGKHAVPGREVRVRVKGDASTGLVDASVETVTFKEQIANIRNSVRDRRTWDGLRGLVLLWHLMNALRDPQAGSIEWMVGEDERARSLERSDSPWYRFLGPPPELTPDKVSLSVRAKGIRALRS